MKDKILSIAQSINPTPTLNALKMAIKHKHLSMQLKYCRKIYTSFLRQQGVQPEIIDMLQGRIGKNIFLRNYLTSSNSYKTEVLQALEKLQGQLSD
jgi:intergrase/recombinase